MARISPVVTPASAKAIATALRRLASLYAADAAGDPYCAGWCDALEAAAKIIEAPPHIEVRA